MPCAISASPFASGAQWRVAHTFGRYTGNMARENMAKRASRTTRAILGSTLRAWKRDRVGRIGAALSFYTIFSLAPLMWILIQLAAFLLGRERVEPEVESVLTQLMGAGSAQVALEMIQQIRQSGGWFEVWLGVFFSLLGASRIFGELRTAFNEVWRVTLTTRSGIRYHIRKRAKAMGMVLATGLVPFISLIVNATLTAFGAFILGESELMAFVINNAVTIVVMSVLFAGLLKFVPDVDLRWRDVWPGAILTGILFVTGQFLFGLYLGSAITAPIRPAASFLLLLTWIYLSSLIVLTGAEFTRAYVENRNMTRVRFT